MSGTRFDFAQARKTTEKELGLESGGFFKPKEGANKLRLLSAPIGHQSMYNGKPTFKYVCWIYDYAEEKVRLYFMPPSIYKVIEGFQASEDYRFDEVPMPYDLRLNAKNAGTIDVEYQLLPAKDASPVPPEAESQLALKGEITTVLEKLKEKERETSGVTEKAFEQAPTTPPTDEEIKIEDIPF
jgi:hypothetical protein